MAINPWRDVHYEGICHTKSKLHKHPLENLFTEQCSLKGLNCHQVLICLCTDTFKKNSGFEQPACKVHFSKQMPVPLPNSVLTHKIKKLNVDSDTIIPQILLLRLSSSCHSGNNTQTSAFRSYVTNRWNFLSEDTYHLPGQQINMHQSQLNYRYLLTLTYSNRFGKTRDLF